MRTGIDEAFVIVRYGWASASDRTRKDLPTCAAFMRLYHFCARALSFSCRPGVHSPKPSSSSFPAFGILGGSTDNSYHLAIIRLTVSKPLAYQSLMIALPLTLLSYGPV